MRLSRGCYDKYRRCPGWIGGGPKYARVKRCEGGYLIDVYERPLWKWRFHRCSKCDVLVLPYVSRWLSVPNLIHEVRWKIRDLAYRWQNR